MNEIVGGITGSPGSTSGKKNNYEKMFNHRKMNLIIKINRKKILNYQKMVTEVRDKMKKIKMVIEMTEWDKMLNNHLIKDKDYHQIKMENKY